jgi:hypothetical protein
MARLLWAFEFHPKLDQFGNAMPIHRDGMTDGMIVGPEPFEYASHDPWKGDVTNYS